MAIQQRKQTKTSILLTFKVLQFVNQIRRRIKPRILDGSTRPCQLGNDGLHSRTLDSVLRGPSWISRHSISLSHHDRRRVCKSRDNYAKRLKPSPKLRASASDVSVSSDISGGQVQQIVTIDHLSRDGNTLSAVASDNSLFLKHDNSPILEGYSLNQTIQLLIAVEQAITTLASCRTQYGDEWLAARGSDIGLDMDESFIANYEHLLERLWVELNEALTHKAHEELLRGGHDKRQRKLLAWFSEFAEKPRPLSTSFPWSIKPSLAVLWGVCWMFYDRDIGEDADQGVNNRVSYNKLLRNLDFPTTWSAPASSDYFNFGLELIGGQAQHEAQPPSGNNVTAELDDSFQGRNADTWPPDFSPSQDFRLPSNEDVRSLRFGQAPPQLPGQTTYYPQVHHQLPDISPVDVYLPHDLTSPLTAFPLGTNSNRNPDLPWHPLPRNSLPQGSRARHLIPGAAQTPSILVNGSPGSDFGAPPHSEFAAFGIYHQPQASPLQLHTSFEYNNYNQYTMGSQLSPDNASIQVPQIITKHERTGSVNSNSGMPTPASMAGPQTPLLSPTSAEPPHMTTSSPTHSRRISEDRSSIDDDEDGSMRKNHSYKRAEEPSRNSEGKMTCRHSECAGLVFDRKCEWSKHMDKHDRPYKCNVKGCEKLQGFTYSGGLLRHEREVHKMHGGTKKSLFCPFPDCKRSSGAGFTRKENLAEHVRRVHRRTSMSADMHGLIIRREVSAVDGSPIPESRATSMSPYTRTMDYREDEEMSLKRKRGSESGFSDRGNDDLRAEIKRLRHENEEKDSRLRQLEAAVMALQHQTRR